MAPLCLAMLPSCATSGQGSAGSSAAPASSGVDDTAERYAAYYAKCQEYSTIYGAPSMESVGMKSSVASGLALVRLVDFDGDGTDELLLGYIVAKSNHDSYEQAVEVWSYRDGSAVCDCITGFSPHTTNGFFPYIEVASRSDGPGAVIVKKSCFGSGPARFAYELLGYGQDGSFGALLRIANESKYEGTYFICPVAVDAYWHTEDWNEVTKEEYDSAFRSIAGETTLHLHMFDEDAVAANCEYGSSLSDTIASTRETISYLAQHAG